MPVHVEKGRGKRPYKIKERGGKTVGSSTNRVDAEASARARNAAYREKQRGGRPQGGTRR